MVRWSVSSSDVSLSKRPSSSDPLARTPSGAAARIARCSVTICPRRSRAFLSFSLSIGLPFRAARVLATMAARCPKYMELDWLRGQRQLSLSQVQQPSEVGDGTPGPRLVRSGGLAGLRLGREVGPQYGDRSRDEIDVGVGEGDTPLGPGQEGRQGVEIEAGNIDQPEAVAHADIGRGIGGAGDNRTVIHPELGDR